MRSKSYIEMATVVEMFIFQLWRQLLLLSIWLDAYLCTVKAVFVTFRK